MNPTKKLTILLLALLLCLFSACTPAEPVGPVAPGGGQENPDGLEEQENNEEQTDKSDNICNYIGVNEPGYSDDDPGLEEAIDSYYKTFLKEIKIEEFPAELWKKATFETERHTVLRTICYEKESGAVLSESEYLEKQKEDPNSVSLKAVRTHQTAIVRVQLPQEAHFEFCASKGISFYMSSEGGSWNAITPLESSAFVKNKEAAAETYLYGLTGNDMLQENFGENWKDNVVLSYSKMETQTAFALYKVQLEIDGKTVGSKGYGPFLFYVSNDGGNWHVEQGLTFDGIEPGNTREWSPGILNPTEIALQYPEIPKTVVDAEVVSYGEKVGYWGEKVKVTAFEWICTHRVTTGETVEVYKVQEQRFSSNTGKWYGQGSNYLFFKLQGEERILLERRIMYPDVQDTVEELAEAAIHGTDSIHYAFRNQKLVNGGNVRWYGLSSISVELGQGELLERKTSTEAIHNDYGYWEGMYYSDLLYWRAKTDPNDESTWNVNQIETTNPDVVTWRGIHVGSTRAEVLEAYPEAHDEPYRWREGSILWCNGYDHREEENLNESHQTALQNQLGNALLFYFENDIVVKMEVVSIFD